VSLQTGVIDQPAQMSCEVQATARLPIGARRAGDPLQLRCRRQPCRIARITPGGVM
jgi:hypothetical protein